MQSRAQSRISISMGAVLFALPLVASGQSPSDAVTTAPPAPHCADVRQLKGSRQPDPHTLVVTSSEDRFYKVSFAHTCPDVLAARSAEFQTPQGFVCGGGGQEFVQAGTQRCRITSVEEIDARQYAQAARNGSVRRSANQATKPSATDGVVDLEGVTSVGRRRPQGVVASPQFCFVQRYVRGWAEDPKGVTVDVSAFHPGGYRKYRLETAGACNIPSHAGLAFVSGVHMGVICGNPGDKLQFRPQETNPVQIPGQEPPEELTECAVGAVYPEVARH